MRIIFFGLFLCVLMGSGIYSLKQNNARIPASLFEGSVFREASDIEKSFGIQVLSCSGNLLKSSDGNLYAMTARHCLNFIQTCADITVRLKISQEKPIEGRCKEIKIDDKENDIVIFRVEFFNDGLKYQPPEDLKFCLDNTIASVGTPLKVVHFPSINENKTISKKVVQISTGHIPNNIARVSENCQVITPPEWCDICRDKQTVQWANCGLFSGSSGSGLVNLKSNCITGVAHAADPADKIYGRNDKRANFAVVANFVEKYKKELLELKIQMAAQTELPPRNSKELIQNTVKGVQ